jgi:hypothetical protein
VPPIEATVFVGNGRDLWATFEAAEVGGRANETVAVEASGVNGADWLAHEDAARDVVVEQLAAWALFQCKCDPEHSECRLHGCVCKNGWSGAECRERMVPYAWFARMQIMATIMPTIMVLVVSIVAWKVLVKSGDGTRAGTEGSMGLTRGRWAGMLKIMDKI